MSVSYVYTCTVFALKRNFSNTDLYLRSSWKASQTEPRPGGAGEGVCFYQERSQTKGKVVITKMPAGFLGLSGHIPLVLHVFPKSGVLAGP